MVTDLVDGPNVRGRVEAEIQKESDQFVTARPIRSVASTCRGSTASTQESISTGSARGNRTHVQRLHPEPRLRRGCGVRIGSTPEQSGGFDGH